MTCKIYNVQNVPKAEKPHAKGLGTKDQWCYLLADDLNNNANKIPEIDSRFNLTD